MGMTNLTDLNLRFSVIAEAVAGDFTVTGIATADKIVAVVGYTAVLSEAAPNTVAFTAVDLTSEFSITAADTINNAAGTALTDGWALVVWFDVDET